LAQRRGRLPGHRVKLHQPGVRRLVPGVQRHLPPRIVDPAFVVFVRAVPFDQRLQHPGERLAQAVGQEELPFVEFGAIGQAEPGHEIVTVQLGSGRQGIETPGAQLLWSMPVRVHRRQQALEFAHVEPDVSLWVERDLHPADVQHLVAQRLFELREGAAQVGARAGLIVFGPEQRGERVAIVGLGGDGQVRQQG